MLVGPVWRLQAAEQRHLLQRKEGHYGLTAATTVAMHSELCAELLGITAA